MFDSHTITDQQRDGIACIVCADETAPMRPVGTLDRVQIFACVSHATAEVPPCAR